MPNYPVIDHSFTLEDALCSFGFKIDEKDSGVCIAYDYFYSDYGEIFIEFNQSFITNYQTDMRIFYKDNARGQQINLFLGVAPTNSKDFKTLMNLLLPSEDFKDSLGIMV